MFVPGTSYVYAQFLIVYKTCTHNIYISNKNI